MGKDTNDSLKARANLMGLKFMQKAQDKSATVEKETLPVPVSFVDIAAVFCNFIIWFRR